MSLLRPALPFQQITPAFVSFETLLGISIRVHIFPRKQSFYLKLVGTKFERWSVEAIRCRLRPVLGFRLDL